jgi:clan AA aspartic protease (TIGR02281 family)
MKKKILEKTGQRLSGLDQFEAQLYKDWLREIIVKGGYFSGMAAFEEARRAFPDDLEIHLLGVQAALAENNRERARELLEMRSYPPPFDERANQLAERIKELEDQEAVAVRFNTGDESIRVAAYLNGTYYQNFVVDTGTSMTTIPSSAVEALKIRVDESTPVRAVLTASGMGVTYEVTLDSIELEGLRVNNLKVLIIDLPGVPDYGLLGLDFLNNFRFEIDKRQGILRLKKREPS